MVKFIKSVLFVQGISSVLHFTYLKHSFRERKAVLYRISKTIFDFPTDIHFFHSPSPFF